MVTSVVEERLVSEEAGVRARQIDYPKSPYSCAVGKLRHAYFVRHRRWVPCDGTGLESDHYDPLAHHLAVFRNCHLAAYLRLLPWQQETGFMLEHEFSCLISQEERSSLIREHSAEISRLVFASTIRPQTQQPEICQSRPNTAPPIITNPNIAAPSTPTILTPGAAPPLPGTIGQGTREHHPKAQHQNTSFQPHVMEVLLKLLYHVSLQHHITTYYLVVETTWLKTFTRRFGIPFTPIGTPYTFPDGTKTQAAFTTLADIEHTIATNHPHKYQWYRQLP